MADPYGLELSGLDPEYVAELRKLSKQEKMAEELAKRGMQPLQGQMVGNTYVRPSIFQGLAGLANSWVAKSESDKVEEGYKSLGEKRKAMEDSERQKIIDAMAGTQERTEQLPEGTFGPPQTFPAVPPNRQNIMNTMLASRIPEFRKGAMQMLVKEKLGTPEGFTLSPGQVRYGPDGKPLVSAPGADAKPPSSVQEYQFAKQQGYAGSYEQWVKDKARAGATSISLPPQEKGFETELGKKQAEALIKGRDAADDAVEIIRTVGEGRKIMDKGMVTGFGANQIVGIGQALKQAGIDFGGDATANAQAYTATMAQNVGKIIKQFGAGTGLSDADREYATKMAGGSIAIDEKAIRKILDINERAARNIIQLQNKRAKGVKTNIPLTVDEPPSLTQSQSGGGNVRVVDW